MSVKIRTARFLTACLLLAVTSVAAYSQSQEPKGPVVKDRLLEALRKKEPPQETLIREVKRYGVDFEMTSEDEEEFKQAHATPELIKAIRENFRPTEQPASDDAVCKAQSMIMILQVSKETDAKEVIYVKRKLLELGYKKDNVKGPWPNKNPNDRPETSEVRFFYDDDEKCANLVSKSIEEAFPNMVVEATKGQNPSAPPAKHTLQLYIK
jgi:uncharacterized membrane protein